MSVMLVGGGKFNILDKTLSWILASEEIKIVKEGFSLVHIDQVVIETPVIRMYGRYFDHEYSDDSHNETYKEAGNQTKWLCACWAFLVFLFCHFWRSFCWRQSIDSHLERLVF